jgi:hypothetical protein
MTLSNRPILTSVRAITSIILFYLFVLLSCIPFCSLARAESIAETVVRVNQEESLAAHRNGELLVRFRPGVPQQAKDTILASHGARRKKSLRGESAIESLQLSSGSDLKMAAFELLMEPQVELAEPNFLISKDDLTPNDPQFGRQWALRNVGQEGGQFGSDIKINKDRAYRSYLYDNPQHAPCREAKQILVVGDIIAEEFGLIEFKGGV